MKEHKKNIRLLLVDDREDNLLSMEIVLENDDYSFIRANSGREALKILLNDQDFSLILMDVKMPGLDGYETAELIYQRDKLKHIPIIFITANSYTETSVYKGYKAGAVDYIYKPFNAELLRSKVFIFTELYRKNKLLSAQEQKLKLVNKKLLKEIKEHKLADKQISILNKELLSHIEKLKFSNEELEQFAYVASHDLQEPLRKIRIWSDIILSANEEKQEEGAGNYLKKIQQTAEQMQTMVKGILSYSKIPPEAENRKKHDLNKIIASALVDLEVKITEKKAKINIEKLPHAWVEPALLSRVFQNIVGNSLKFSRDNHSPHIIIKQEELSDLTEIDNPEKYCHISITDNGIGFEEKYAKKIFGMFQRLNNKSEYEGSGIGLAICKKIIEQHKGLISVKSELNQGSKFLISLPLSENLN